MAVTFAVAMCPVWARGLLNLGWTWVLFTQTQSYPSRFWPNPIHSLYAQLWPYPTHLHTHWKGL